MITVYGEGRGFRVVWLLEEMGLPYKLRPVDLLAGVENDPEYLAINPSGFIPALQDDDIVMVESTAIMAYLTGRYGPTDLAPNPQDAAYALYQQFLHFGEASLAVPYYIYAVTQFAAPEDARDNWSANFGRDIFRNRMKLVTRQLERAPYIAGDTFTAADISVTYALEFTQRHGFEHQQTALDYLARVTSRDGYSRAMDVCKTPKRLPSAQRRISRFPANAASIWPCSCL